jgi:hypothetical protein
MKNFRVHITIGILFILCNFYFSYVYALDPIIKRSPSCGKFDDHRLNITVNGFNPYVNVYSEFIKSKQVSDTFSYFKTNSTGGFDDYTIVDDLYPDEYTLRFIDDKNNDIRLINEEKRLNLNKSYHVIVDNEQND